MVPIHYSLISTISYSTLHVCPSAICEINHTVHIQVVERTQPSRINGFPPLNSTILFSTPLYLAPHSTHVPYPNAKLSQWSYLGSGKDPPSYMNGSTPLFQFNPLPLDLSLNSTCVSRMYPYAKSVILVIFSRKRALDSHLHLYGSTSKPGCSLYFTPYSYWSYLVKKSPYTYMVSLYSTILLHTPPLCLPNKQNQLCLSNPVKIH